MSKTHQVKQYELSSLVTYATRYALGRQTYAVCEMIGILKVHWEHLWATDRMNILQDLQQALREDRCGAEIDCKAWAEFLKWAIKYDER